MVPGRPSRPLATSCARSNCCRARSWKNGEKSQRWSEKRGKLDHQHSSTINVEAIFRQSHLGKGGKNEIQYSESYKIIQNDQSIITSSGEHLVKIFLVQLCSSFRSRLFLLLLLSSTFVRQVLHQLLESREHLRAVFWVKRNGGVCGRTERCPKKSDEHGIFWNEESS